MWPCYPSGNVAAMFYPLSFLSTDYFVATSLDSFKSRLKTYLFKKYFYSL